ncbi:MAG: hypothetical protein M3P18_10590, partial [Actinomycetota bacterium]|nr:hypothetical protein [Actinomycetota bacterium]
MTIGIDREPAQLAEGTTFGDNRQRMKHEGTDLIPAEAKLDPRLGAVLERWFFVLGHVLDGPHEHEDDLLRLLVGEPHHPDPPLGLWRFEKLQSRIAPRLGGGEGVGRVDHHQQLSQL